ncbi:MAG: hypothetical protein KJ593_00425 [Candidatus Omnitrophica bacterium]|nr:hypothetical protein [Candidatus Omnitrophota bacterium]
MTNRIFILIGLMLLVIIFTGCASGSWARIRGDYAIKEADWIREGSPIIYESKSLYPTEHVENHLDREMEYVGEFQQVPFYVELRQIKPYNRLYTKFNYHKYRLFLLKEKNDRD